MAVMLMNYSTHMGQGPQGAWAIQLQYKDLDKISSCAGDGVMFAALKKYMGGYPDGTFGPQNQATRAEVAAIMERYNAPEPAAEGTAQ